MTPMTRVYHPRKTFADAIDGLAGFARERGLDLGSLNPDELERVRDEQRRERAEFLALERRYLEASRSYAKAQAGRFQRFMKALDTARAEFRDDSTALRILDGFSATARRHVPDGTEKAPTSDGSPAAGQKQS